jgi:hypothetical protein
VEAATLSVVDPEDAFDVNVVYSLTIVLDVVMVLLPSFPGFANVSSDVPRLFNTNKAAPASAAKLNTKASLRMVID